MSSQSSSDPSGSPLPTPLRLGVLIYPGFQPLDVFGPLDTFGFLSKSHPVTLSILSTSLEPVSTAVPGEQSLSPTFSQSLNPTETLDNAPPLDVLLVPGGRGSRNISATAPYVDFIRERWADSNLKYVLSVCTGAALVARTGCVDGKRGTSNKFAFEWVKSQREEVQWIGKARWVEDGRWWSSSGVSAGADMTLGWIEKLWGLEKAEQIAKWMEWTRTARDEDPFAIEHGL